MRKDIEIHINTNDVTLVSNTSNKVMGFKWVENKDGLSKYIYGEVILPGSKSDRDIINEGVYINIPYTPVFKECAIRFKRVSNNGRQAYLINPRNGSEWFVIQAQLYGVGEKFNIHASELIEISDDLFYVLPNGEYVDIFSGHQSDFNIIDANKQNTNCLISCVPTNNYRYPFTGVGMVRWLNSTNLNGSTLAETLIREFGADGVNVINAQYDYESQQIALDIDSTNV